MLLKVLESESIELKKYYLETYYKTTDLHFDDYV